MRITKLLLENFLRHASLAVPFDAPVTYILGPNASGKSSIAEAIALVFGFPGRAGLKKNLPDLITNRAKTGLVNLEYQDQDHAYTVSVALPSGKRVGTTPDNPFIPYAMGLQSLQTLSDKDLRSTVTDLAGTPLDVEKFGAILSAQNIHPKISSMAVTSYRAGGFPEALKSVKEALTGRKAVWEEITGERYGKVKAETWIPQLPACPDDAKFAEIENRIRQAEAVYQQAAEDLGKAKSLASQFERAERASRFLDSQPLAPLWKQEESLRKAIANLPEPQGDELVCPHCSGHVVYRNGKLAKAQSQGSVTLDQFRAELEQVQREILDMERKVDLAKQLLATNAVSQDYTEFETKVAVARTQLNTLIQERKELEQSREAYHRAVSNADRCSQVVKQIRQLEKAVELLEPTGIQTTLINEALNRINEVAQQLSATAGWPLVQISPDLVITYGGRSARLCSESEQWRVDAVLRTVVARLADVGFVLLDRFDVLDPKGRAGAAKLFSSAPEQYIVCGTASRKPVIQGAQVVWLGEQENAAQAA